MDNILPGEALVGTARRIILLYILYMLKSPASYFRAPKGAVWVEKPRGIPAG